MSRLMQLRINAGLSPNELSRRVKVECGRTVSAKTIRSIEAGGTNPYPSSVKVLADFFGMTATELLAPSNDDDLTPAA